MGFVQIFSHKIATTLKSAWLVVSPVPTMLLKSSALHWQCMAESVQTFVGSQPAKREM